VVPIRKRGDFLADQAAGSVTCMLQAACNGDPQAAAALLPLIYTELRALATARLAQTPPGNTFQPTALVHEAYLRLVGHGDPGWNSRGHFFGAAAQAMRQILVEQARRKASKKHGGGCQRVPLDQVEPSTDPPAEELLALDEALTRLESAEPMKGKIVSLRYFAGLTAEQAAAALGMSVPTLEREWRSARAFLYTLLTDSDATPGGRR